jgi:hypothetical protein
MVVVNTPTTKPQTDSHLNTTITVTAISGVMRAVRSSQFSRKLTAHSYHNLPPSASTYHERSTLISGPQNYFQWWLAAEDSDDYEDEDYQPTVHQDSNNDYEYPTLEHGLYSPPDSCNASQSDGTPVLNEETPGSNELSRDGTGSLALQYLNLGHSTSEFDSTAEGDIGSPSTSDDTATSTSIATPSEDADMSWGNEPTSPPLVGVSRFGTEIGLDNTAITNAWPRRNYTYQSPRLPGYFDSEDYLRECEVRRIEGKLRARLAERFAKEGIYGFRNAEPGERRGVAGGGTERERVEVENSPSIVAFSQVIRGRTIYNP